MRNERGPGRTQPAFADHIEQGERAMKLKGSTWGYLVALLLAIMAAAVVLPGCGDDGAGPDSSSVAVL
jgi:hypothetical protein